jgi:hypothetical protein
MWAAPVGTAVGDPGWQLLGHTTGDAMCVVVEDGEPFDIEALRRGLAGGQVVTGTFTMTRRQMSNPWRVVAPRTRNRRRNPLHAVRDHLRRQRRWITRGR